MAQRARVLKSLASSPEWRRLMTDANGANAKLRKRDSGGSNSAQALASATMSLVLSPLLNYRVAASGFLAFAVSSGSEALPRLASFPDETEATFFVRALLN